MIDNSYVKEFTALVIDCQKSGDFFKVELDSTAFFPEGGGQGADKGTLSGVEVCDVQTENGHTYHYVKEALSGEVVGVINWETRFDRMQNHTGEHILSGVIHTKFGYDNIGFHLGDSDVTCDYNGPLTWDDVKAVEAQANSYVFDDRKVTVSFPEDLSKINYRSKLDLTENIRIVTIDGVDCCACCAPHVSSTAQVGLIKVINIEKSHGGTRLHFRCGRRALLDYDEKQMQCLKIGELLSARQFELSECVENLQAANKSLEFSIGRMSEKVALAKLESVEHQADNLIIFIENADNDALLALANGGRDKTDKIFVALTNSEDGYRYIISSNSVNLREKSKEINDALAGRGGGRPEMIQGAFQADLETIKNYFEK